jgi:steroid delta-isomerase-like uncharacterized protein
MSTEQNKKLVQKFWDEWNHGNMEGCLNLINQQKAQDHALPPGFPEGFEGVRQLILMYHQAFPDLQFMVEDMIAESDKVVCRLTTRGTHKGEFMGIPATGKVVTSSGINIFRVEEGKMVERWSNQDDLGMLQQLGVIPLPGQAATPV